MNDQEYQQLRETSWRRRLTEAEAAELQRHLTAHPELRADWDAEAGLNLALEKLPEAPAVSSNFTALVLQAVERDAAAQKREASRGWRGWRGIARWLPKAAVAALVLSFTFVRYEQYEAHNRMTLARNAAEISAVVSASNPDLMKDMEPIMRLSDSQPKPDTELLALMK